MGSNQSFTFSSPNNSIITNGANALKIEEEVNSESQEASGIQRSRRNKLFFKYNSGTGIEIVRAKPSHSEAEISDEKKEENIESSSSNGLENFDFNEDETLELFNSDGEKDENNEDSFLSSETSEKEEEDELEIPAFLRRQKINGLQKNK